MATLRGEGAFKGVNLIVHAPKNGQVVKPDEKTGKDVYRGAYLDVQVDQSLKNADKVKAGEAQADSNPHLASFPAKGKDGTNFVSHRVFYNASQVAKIKEAAGKKAATLENGDEVYGVKADVFANAKKQLLINTTHDLAASKNPRFGKTVLDKQNAVTLSAKAVRAQERAEAELSDASEVVPEAEAAEDTPEV